MPTGDEVNEAWELRLRPLVRAIRRHPEDSRQLGPIPVRLPDAGDSGGCPVLLQLWVEAR